MHGHLSQAEFLAGMAAFLGVFYLSLAIMNAIAAAFLWESGRGVTLFRVNVFGLYSLPFTTPILWLLVATYFVALSPLAFSGDPYMMWWVSLPTVVIDTIDYWVNPTVYTVGSLVFFGSLFWMRRFFVKPVVAWSCFNLVLLFMGFSMTNQSFSAIVTKADNVPIVGLMFLLGFFTWLATSRAVANDDRALRGEPPLESVDNEKVLVWPDLVYTELICMVAVLALLLVWGLLLQAPLEEPASSVKTPNPSKAPWYFLGLQEMLVYYDPWMAGVVLPSVILFGLIAIPYLDFNKLGNGYYTISQRKFAYLNFQFGFLVLWVTLIVMGTFLRGPNWNFFHPFETWDTHKVEALSNVDLSQWFWNDLFGVARPKAPEGSGGLKQFLYIAYRESPGIVFIIGYLVLLPPVMAATFMRKFFIKMGFIRFMVLSNLMLMMGLLPLKMILRWSVNLKYFISIPEYFLNL